MWTKRHQCTLKTKSSPISCAVSDFIIINTCTGKCFVCFVFTKSMNKQGTKFVGAAYQYFFIKQMLIFRVIFILNNFFSKYIVAKLIITFYIPVIHYCYKVKFFLCTHQYHTVQLSLTIVLTSFIMLLTVTAPVNLVASSPSATQLTVSWTRPNNTVSSSTYIPDATASSWLDITVLAYTITMHSTPKIFNFSDQVLKR